MKILLTGATGYIGRRILPLLINEGYFVICCVRDISRFKIPKSYSKNISVIEIDLLDYSSLSKIPDDIDAAYYLVHSMSSSGSYDSLEQKSAINFCKRLSKTNVKQVIYLSGIVNESNLSRHLTSRKTVEEELGKGKYNFTCLRAGIIVGSGSASFEIIRDLVEKLPIMIAPKWLLTKCQPIGISDVIRFLIKSLFNEKTFNRNFDIGSNDILSYKEILLDFAHIRKLKRKIWTIPVMTPKLSSYWLYFVTSTSYKLAQSLVDSMKVEVICRDNEINGILDIDPISYKQAVKDAFDKIENNEIVGSWKNFFTSTESKYDVSEYINPPTFGCFTDKLKTQISNRNLTIEKIWSIGGDNDWYFAGWLWRLRGFIDKLLGGIGLRKGRTNQNSISVGDSLDFWQVIYTNKNKGRLLLFAEMKLPGEAWLEFRIEDNNLIQTSTFRPLGLAGRVYWFCLYPIHSIVFRGLFKKLTTDIKT